jgi:hypothetical protein
MRRLLLLLLLSSILILPLPSCAPANSFDGGRPITPSDLESISAEVFGTAEESELAETGTETPLNPNQTVYWLPGGDIYHIRTDCAHLSGKRNIQKYTLRTAESNGLTLCEDCGG